MNIHLLHSWPDIGLDQQRLTTKNELDQQRLTTKNELDQQRDYLRTSATKLDLCHHFLYCITVVTFATSCYSHWHFVFIGCFIRCIPP